MSSLQKSLRHESKRLRDSARGRDCTVRLPGICNFRPETTVLAHLNGGGAGTKHSDLMGAFTCSACHDEIDGRTRKLFPRDVVKLAHMEGIMRTQQAWLDEGLVKI
jgi:hypothetical protein